MKTVIALVAVAALALSGCVPDYVKDNDSPVMLIIGAINGGSPLQSDVLTEDGGTVSDTVSVAVANRAKNQNSPLITIPQHILITNYNVRYFRSDRRATEGVDVPFRISGGLASEVDVATSGTVDVPVEVVRNQAKLEPPLKNLRLLGGAALVVTMFAEITIYGHTIAGENVSATGVLQIDFADFAN